VTPAEPDFTLTAAADRFALAAGQALELPVTVARQHGLAGEIEVMAEGLPAGVLATRATAAGNATKATLRLTAAADAVGAAGVFRVIGRAAGGPARREATAPLPAPFTGAAAVRAPTLWVTVTKSAPAPPPARPKK
jgi:hypothetical protein